MPTYGEMKNLMEARANAHGFSVGTPVRFGRRVGVVSGFNPFFYDERDPSVRVDFEAQGRFKARKGMLVCISRLQPLSTSSSSPGEQTHDSR